DLAASVRPRNDNAEVVPLFLEEPLIGGAQIPGCDVMCDKPGQADAAGRERGQEPALCLVDVPGAGEAGVRRLEEHVAMGAGDFKVAAMEIVVEIDLLDAAARAADHNDLPAVARQGHGLGN